jgi:hypothetical protein
MNDLQSFSFRGTTYKINAIVKYSNLLDEIYIFKFGRLLEIIPLETSLKIKVQNLHLDRVPLTPLFIFEDSEDIDIIEITPYTPLSLTVLFSNDKILGTTWQTNIKQ